MRRVRGLVAFGVAVVALGLSAGQSGAAPVRQGVDATERGLAQAGAFGPGLRISAWLRGGRFSGPGSFREARGYGAFQGGPWRTGGVARHQAFAGGFWPSFGDGAQPPLLIGEPPRFRDDVSILDAPGVLGIRTPPPPPPEAQDTPRSRPPGPGPRIFSRGGDGAFRRVEPPTAGSGPKILTVDAVEDP